MIRFLLLWVYYDWPYSYSLWVFPLAFWEQEDQQVPKRANDFQSSVQFISVSRVSMGCHCTCCGLRGLPRPLRGASGASVAVVTAAAPLISSSILARPHIDSTHTLF